MADFRVDVQPCHEGLYFFLVAIVACIKRQRGQLPVPEWGNDGRNVNPGDIQFPACCVQSAKGRRGVAVPQQDYGWSFGRGTQLQQAGFRTSLEIGSADEGKDVVIEFDGFLIKSPGGFRRFDFRCAMQLGAGNGVDFLVDVVPESFRLPSCNA